MEAMHVPASAATDRSCLGVIRLSGHRRGVRIGSVKDGKVTAYIPDSTPIREGAGPGTSSRGEAVHGGRRRQCLCRHERHQDRAEITEEVRDGAEPKSVRQRGVNLSHESTHCYCG